MDFPQWIQLHLDNRGWLPTDLIRSAALRGYTIDSGYLSRIMNREREAGIETVIAIAEGFHVPREEAFRARGWLAGDEYEVTEADDSQIKYLLAKIQRLPSSVRQHIVNSVVAAIDAVQEAQAGEQALLGHDDTHTPTNTSSAKTWVTVAEAARQTGYAERTIQKWLQEGRIEGDRPQHEWRTTIESILAYKRQVKRGRPKKS